MRKMYFFETMFRVVRHMAPRGSSTGPGVLGAGVTSLVKAPGKEGVEERAPGVPLPPQHGPHPV